jgi:murein L,D-transpeptidase YafK
MLRILTPISRQFLMLHCVRGAKERRVLMRARLFALCLAIAAGNAFAAEAPKPADLIVVDKAKRELTLYAKKKKLKTYRIVLGGNPVGDKEKEGDSRTPEGRYTIDAKNPNSSFYKSLHISYPDNTDLAQARRRRVSPGGAIMIHGTPEYIAALYATGIYPDWTAGCIAVTNDEMDEIFRSVRIGTKIVIRP